ncbi:MAG: hypothetical protein N4A65_02835 [Cohaesibacter sp.]|nr:hypothetical protein [Cohaesibacter sp.]
MSVSHAPHPSGPPSRSVPFTRRKSWLVALAGLVLAGGGFWAGGGLSLFGQKLEDRATEYYKSYDGAWDLACDKGAGENKARCYGQLVDVYSNDPNFRAAILHLTYEDDGKGGKEPQLLFNLERDLDFTKVGVSLAAADGARKALSFGDCSGNQCKIKGAAAEQVLAAWREADSLLLDLPEKEGRKTLSWPLASFSGLLDDLTAQREKRGLL